MHRPFRLLAGLFLFCSATAQAAAINLYDDSLGSVPDTQPWLYAAGDGAFTETATAGGVNLVTSEAVSAGYSNYLPIIGYKNAAFPTLDRAAGFTLEFELQLNSESHANNNRAGFSVILLDSDHLGIEIAFWEDRVWAQNAGFTQGEGAPFATVRREVFYQLGISGNSYGLFANGQSLLQGVLRDYSGAGPTNPYAVQNFVFLGDDTSSAGADVDLGQVTLRTGFYPQATVAAPSSLALLMAVLLVGRFRRGSQSSLRCGQSGLVQRP
jgi:hypothetical protein